MSSPNTCGGRYAALTGSPYSVTTGADELAALRARVAELEALLRRARPHVNAPLGTLAAEIDIAIRSPHV